MLGRSFGCVFIFWLLGFLRLKMGRSCFISLNLFFLSILFNRFLSWMLMFCVFIWVIIVLLKKLMLEKFVFFMSCLMFIGRWLKWACWWRMGCLVIRIIKILLLWGCILRSWIGWNILFKIILKSYWRSIGVMFWFIIL